MAQSSDGSITIDTELDNSGFERGSEKLNSAIDKLVNGVNDMGNTMKSSLSAITPLLQQIASNTASIYNQMSQSASQATQANDQLINSNEELSNTTTAAGQSANQATQAMSSFNTQAGQTSTSVSSLEREVNSLSSNMDAVSRSAETGFANGNAVLSFDQKLRTLETHLDEAKTKVEAFGQTKIPTEEYAWLQQAIQKTSAQLDGYIEKQIQMENTGVSQTSSQWKTVTQNINSARTMLETYRAEMASMEATGEAFTLGTDTASYQQMNASLQAISSQLEQNKSLIDQEAIAQARLNVQTAQEKVFAAETATQREKAIAELQSAQTKLADVASQSSNQSAPAPDVSSRWGVFATVLKKVGAAAVSAGAKLAKLTFKTIATGVKKAVSGLKNFVTQAHKTSGATNGLVRQLTSLKTMLVTRLKSAFISQITSAVSQGITSLAQYSSSFNQAMSNMKNSMTQLGGNVAVAFGNILTTLEPVLTKIINLISTAVNYFNAFFSLLSGKSTMTVAKKGTDNYAKSVSGAAAAQKELNRQVYGFDELNKRNKESDSSSGSSSDTGTEYEDISVDSVLPDGVMDWFNRLKEAFENGDWYGIGQIIAEGLNTAMSIADNWINNTFRPLGVLWASRIAQILNGLVDGFDWGSLGKTIADGMNAIADIINTFLTTFNFEDLGIGIGTAINGWFNNIEWDLMGQTLANGLNAIVDTIYGIVSTIEWDTIGSDISEFINNFVDTVDLDKAALTLATTLNGVKTAVQNFIDGTEWDEAATKVGNSINTLFENIEWADMGATITNGFNTIMKAISTGIQTIKWSQIGSSFAQALQNLITNIKWSNLGKLAGNALIAALNLLTGFIEEMDWLALASSLTSGLIDFITSIDWITLVGKLLEGLVSLFSGAVELLLGLLSGIFSGIGDALEGIGGDCIGGLFKGIGDALSAIGTWLKTNIFDPIVNGIKSLFGIHSPSTVFAELGGYLIDGLLSGISGAWSTITGFFSGALKGLKSILSNAWSNIKSTASKAWNGIKSTVTTVFTNVKSSLTSTASNIKSNLSSAWSNIKSTASKAWNGIKSSVTTAFTNVKSSLTSTASNIKSNLSSAWSSVKSTASKAWNGIKSSVSSSFTNLKSSLSSTASNIKTTISSAWSSIKSTASSKWSDIKSTVSSKWSSLKDTLKSTDWTSIGGHLVNGLKNGISNTWSGLTSSVGGLCKNLTSKVKSVFGINSPSRVFAEIGGFLDAGMEQGIENNKSSLLNTASNLADAVTDGMTPGNPEIELSADSTVNGMLSVADQLSGIADTFKGISAILSGMDSFTIPQIAAGTIVPYGTKIDSTSTADAPTSQTDPTVIKSFAEDVDERLSALSYGQQQLIEAIKSLHLNIDTDALSRAVTKAQRDRSLNFGGV